MRSAMGYLQPTDTIVFNVHELLVRGAEAKRVRWPTPATVRRCAVTLVPVAGRSAHLDHQGVARSTCATAASSATHDFLIASRIAEAVCGGDVEAGSLVERGMAAGARAPRVHRAARHAARRRSASWACCRTGKPVRN